MEVFQSEGALPEEILQLCTMVVEGLSNVPVGNEIIVQFRIDLSGLLTATAIEKRTSLTKSVTIYTAGQHRINLDTPRGNLAALFEEHSPDRLHLTLAEADEDDNSHEKFAETPPTESSGKLLASAKSLRTRATRLLETGLSDSDATAVRTHLAEIVPSIEARNWPALQGHLDALSDPLFYLED